MNSSGRGRCAAIVAWLVVLLALPRAAAAADPPKREVPDYSGRGGEPTTVGDVLLWIPRIILSPLYFTSEFIIRRPLGALIAGAERANLPEALYDFFAFGPDHKAGIIPIAFLDFGFRPSVGLYAFWNDAIVKGNDLRLRGSFWGADWLAGSFTDRIHLGKLDTLSLNGSAIHRPDYVFFGIGPNSLNSNRARYGADTFDASITTDLRPVRFIHVQAGVGVRSVSFRAGEFDEDPSVEQKVAEGAYPLPPGFATGYTAEYNHLLLAFDTRRSRPESGSGIRIEAEGEQGSDFRNSPKGGWIRYGGAVGGFYDIGGGRVVNLSTGVRFVEPLGREPIPFTELVSLGGEAPMRGYYPGRLRDRSGAAATLRYRWPIWAWLDGSMQVAVGNVFGKQLSGFDLNLGRISGAIGIESVGTPDSSFEFLFGLGTETFEHGTQVNSFRLLFGSNRGF